MLASLNETLKRPEQLEQDRQKDGIIPDHLLEEIFTHQQYKKFQNYIIENNITSLNLNCNIKDGWNLKHLGQALQYMPVHTVKLSYNTLGGSMAFEFLDSLIGTSVVDVNLEGNSIDDYHAIRIAELLFTNKKTLFVTALNLSNNVISDSAAQQLGNYVKNTHLREINLSMNQLTHAGILDFIESLQHTQDNLSRPAKLVRAELSCIDSIDQEDAFQIAKAIPQTNLTQLELKLDKDAEHIINKALQSNQKRDTLIFLVPYDDTDCYYAQTATLTFSAEPTKINYRAALREISLDGNVISTLGGFLIGNLPNSTEQIDSQSPSENYVSSSDSEKETDARLEQVRKKLKHLSW